MKKAVLFDMDGTILDTLSDLRDSINAVLEMNGFPVHSTDEVRSFVGNGLRKLAERAVPAGTKPGTIEKVYCDLLAYYQAHCMDSTKPYPGIPELLRELRSRGCRTAVISNKADAAVRELDARFFAGCFDGELGARDGVRLKPDREMADIVLAQLGVPAAEAVYVGDSEVDLALAANAGLDCVAVTWGFRERSVLENHGAERLADSPEELLRILLE